MILELGLPPRWKELRAVIRELLPGPTATLGTETSFESNDVEVLETLISIISLETTLLFRPFLASFSIVIVIEVHQRVMSFMLSIDLILDGSNLGDSYRMVVNP